MAAQGSDVTSPTDLRRATGIRTVEGDGSHGITAKAPPSLLRERRLRALEFHSSDSERGIIWKTGPAPKGHGHKAWRFSPKGAQAAAHSPQSRRLYTSLTLALRSVQR